MSKIRWLWKLVLLTNTPKPYCSCEFHTVISFPEQSGHGWNFWRLQCSTWLVDSISFNRSKILCTVGLLLALVFFGGSPVRSWILLFVDPSVSIWGGLFSVSGCASPLSSLVRFSDASSATSSSTVPFMFSGSLFSPVTRKFYLICYCLLQSDRNFKWHISDSPALSKKLGPNH